MIFFQMPSSKVISYILFFFLILEIQQKQKSIFDGIKLGEKLPQVQFSVFIFFFLESHID